PRTREWLSGVESVAVEGKAGPRHMLGGWMMAQLGMQARQVRMQDARHVRIDLECRIGDEKASFRSGGPAAGGSSRPGLFSRPLRAPPTMSTSVRMPWPVRFRGP
ncbi:MAG TPA: hypothetical protein VFJ79_01505, partial [Acidimicrobiales bacterium]|nr:hypothetical protein [Acidimicrobiales bacterium]